MESNVTLIRNLIKENKTYKHISEISTLSVPFLFKSFHFHFPGKKKYGNKFPGNSKMLRKNASIINVKRPKDGK